MIYDGLSRSGTRIITFAPILKHKLFPLPEIVQLILEMGSKGMGTPIEIEFAVNMSVRPEEPKEFSLLQMRPLVLNRELEILSIDDHGPEELICRSSQVLGNGIINNIYDIVLVDYEKYERSKSRLIVKEISTLNSKLVTAEKPYLLIGVGRWGSADPWLGIPVKWDQISGAKAIVESSFKDIAIEPSQGSHFFQNLTSFMVGYFTINTIKNQGFIDWNWLLSKTPKESYEFTHHLSFEKPITIKMNGQRNQGIILKPE
jgi:hypothetical protein